MRSPESGRIICMGMREESARRVCVEGTGWRLTLGSFAECDVLSEQNTTSSKPTTRGRCGLGRKC